MWGRTVERDFKSVGRQVSNLDCAFSSMFLTTRHNTLQTVQRYWREETRPNGHHQSFIVITNEQWKSRDPFCLIGLSNTLRRGKTRLVFLR